VGSLNADWLAQLAPAHAPPPSGWWPPAPGWWALAALSVLACVLLWYLRRHLLRRPRRFALRELQQLEADSVDDAALARGLERLLRRYALTRYGREAVARLSGAAWIDFVIAHGGRDWSGRAGEHLLRIAYGGQGTADRALWLRGARAFLKSRR